MNVKHFFSSTLTYTAETASLKQIKKHANGQVY